MVRKLEKLSLTLGVLLAISALTALSASAQFESEAESTTLQISSNGMQNFGREGGSYVECTTLKLNNSTQTGKATTSVTVEPSYSNCETYLGASTTMTWNGCDYVYHLAKGATKGTVDIECPSGKVAEIEIGSICKWTISTQTGLGSMTLSNFGTSSTREYFMATHITGITVVRTTNHFFCPDGGSNWTASGSGMVTGVSGGIHVGVYID